MKNENILDAIGMINEEAVRDAKAYQRPKSRKWIKWGAMAACLCLVMAGVFGGANSYLRQYVADNDIQVVSGYVAGDAINAADVTPEQADKIAKANELHNVIVGEDFGWYGSCYYDFDAETVVIGLTDNSTENQNTILALVGDTLVQFFECEYSYQYLEELYAKLDGQRMILYALGVERFNISIEQNRINVYIANAEKYAAIYTINEADSIGGAILFRTNSPTAD